MGYNWYSSEQPSEEIKDKLLMYVEKNPQIDVVLLILVLINIFREKCL